MAKERLSGSPVTESASSCVAVFGLGGTIAMTEAPGGGVSAALSAAELLALDKDKDHQYYHHRKLSNRS